MAATTGPASSLGRALAVVILLAVIALGVVTGVVLLVIDRRDATPATPTLGGPSSPSAVNTTADPAPFPRRVRTVRLATQGSSAAATVVTARE